MRCMLPLVGVLFLMHLLVPVLAAEEVEEVELRLYGAAFQLSDSRPEPEPDAPTLYLDLRRTGDHWWRAFGMAPRLNRGMHDAVIVEQQRDAEGWRLQLLVNFIGDAWVPGGWGEYTLSLRPGEGEGSWQGSYAGTYRGAAVSGGASAQSQVHPAPAAHFRPLETLEHPRLLFRAADLPALREKAATPFGQAAMALMEDSAVGLGMLYQLRGDAAYAERARAAVEVHMADNENGDKMIRTRYVAWRLEQVALAYDLCYDAWDDAFRGRVVSFMQQVMRRMSREQGNWTEYIIWRPTDALSGAIHYAGGLAALALWGQPGPGPDLPADQPSEPSVAAVAAHNFAILEGQPLAAWVEDEMPAEWLYTGPIAGSADPMVARQRATMAADGAARPTVGASLAGSEQTWQVLDDKALVSNNHTGNRRVICVNKAAESAFHTRHGFFTVIENPEAVTVQVQLGHGGAQLLLNGQALSNGDVVRLEPGRYDMLVSVPLGQVNPWALVSLRPHLRSLSPEEVEDILARRRQQQARLAIVNRQRHADWVASGGMDPGVWQAVQLQMFWNGRFFREAMGSGGMQSGSTHALALEGPDILATAHRNVFGRSPSPLPGVENWLPRTLMGMVFAEDGSSSGNNFLTMTPFRIENYQDSRDSTGNIIASLLPLLSAEQQAVALWHWYRHLGIDPSSPDPLALLQVTHRPHVNRLVEASGVAGTGYQVHPVYAFVHVPLDLQPRPPAEVLPSSWYCSDLGFALLRSGWDADAIVLQTTAQQRPSIPVDAPKAGSLALYGFGQSWTNDNAIGDRSLGRRLGESALQIIDSGVNHHGVGQLVAFTQEPASMALSVDLSDVFRRLEVRRVRERAGQRTVHYHDAYDGLGLVRRESAFASQAQAMRAMAADMSGRSGAPLLLVLVDTYQGEDTPTWVWPLTEYNRRLRHRDRDLVENAAERITPADQPLARSPYESERATLNDTGFSLSGSNGAHLQATFVNAADLRIASETIGRVFFTPPGNSISEETIAAITAEGANEFFTIITLQQGPAPAVEVVSGSGLDSVVKVGQLLIRFDGQQVILEDAP